METGRLNKKIEDDVFVNDTINVIGNLIEINLTSSNIEIKHKGKIINRFGYSKTIKKSVISDLAKVIVDIGAIDKIKDARNWIIDNQIFDKVNSLRKILDGKIEEKKQGLSIDNSLMVFNEDYVSMAEQFWKVQPFYYDETGMWWLWNFKDCFWEMIDEIDLLNRLRNHISKFMNITQGNVFNQIIKSLKMIGREKKPKEAKKRWIQFKNKAFSLRSKKIHNVTPDYFFTNPLPWKIGENSKTPTMDKLFTEWVGEKYVSTLYEIIAYCCYKDYPIQVLFCLYGGGRNGKSCFLRVLSKFIGNSNLCSTDLDLLVGFNKSRFEIFKLYKKLLCQLGETNFGVLESSALLKKLTGGDLIGFEVKGKKPFDDYNYAKILIASNSLPTSEDTSEGFYRRWVIIDFPNQFKEGKDIVQTIPNIEYENLSKKITEILPKLIENGEFSNQGSIKERENKYISVSNPLSLFIKECCKEELNGFIRYSEFYTSYVQYLKTNKRRIVSKKEFVQALEREGYEIRRTSKKIGDQFISDRYIENISFCDNYDNYDKTVPSTQIYEVEVGKPAQLSQLSQNKNTTYSGIDKQVPLDIVCKDKIYHKCSICGTKTSEHYDKKGKPICDLCKKQQEMNEITEKCY